MSNTLKLGNGQWATGKDTILAYNDLNSNYKPLAFSFSRNSSATVVNKDGLIETVGVGEPRIDFKDNTKGALLLEPQRTNNLPKSERLDQWSTPSNATVEYGFPDPFGGNKAVKATSSSTDQSYQIYLGFTSANTYNLSVYAKKGTAKVFRIDFGTRDNGYFSVNLETGESAGTSGFSGMINTKIEPLDNDWYRISLTSATVNPNYVRMGANNQEGFLYMAFAQLEQGSYPTSYIPTSGQANGVTRVAESSSQTVPDGVIGQTEGTVYWEINVETTVATANENILNIDNGSGFGHTIYFIKSVTGDLTGEMYVSGGLQASFTKTNITKGVHKMAMGYANNNTAFFVDGVQVSTTDTSCTVPLMSRIQLGNGVFGASDCLSNDVKLYNTRLSNSELAALTTI